MREGPISPMATSNDDDDGIVVHHKQLETCLLNFKSSTHNNMQTLSFHFCLVCNLDCPYVQPTLHGCSEPAVRVVAMCGRWRLPFQRVGGLMHSGLSTATCVFQLVHPAVFERVCGSHMHKPPLHTGQARAAGVQERCVPVLVMKSSIAFHLCAHIRASRASTCVEVVCVTVDFTSVQHPPHRVFVLWQCLRAEKRGCSHSEQSAGCHVLCALIGQASRKTMITHLDVWCP